MANILIVEDDELNRRMYEQVFRFRKHDVEVAVNGEDGLAKASTTKPTLILLDIMMPKMNGLDMLHKLKAIPELAKIPVIVLTNLLGVTTAEAMMAAGAVRYVVKSDYSPKEVCDITEGILAGNTHGKVPAIA